MDVRIKWEKFLKSGSVGDYLKFADCRREQEISEGNRNPFYNTGACNKGNEHRGE